MDLHQRPYSAGPQQYYRTHTTVATSPYHTPPQTHAFTQPLSAHTSAMMGLDLLDCHPNQQLPICGPAPHLHPMALGWSRDTDPINYYSNTPSHLDEYHDLSLYGNMGAIATTGAPLITPHTDTAISSLTAFPSPPTACRKPTYPQTTAEQSSHIQYQASTPRQTATAAKRVKINHDDSPMQDSSTTSLGHNLSSPFGYEAGYPVSTKQSRDTGHMLLEVDNNIKRPADKGAQREARLSTNTAPNATQISCATATRKSGIMKQSRRNTTTGKGKYACPKCGLQFTRNSNCKSHMKIHDPNRKFPHKCTTGQCTKQFSRKTDLVRHVDSVRSLCPVASPCRSCSLVIGT